MKKKGKILLLAAFLSLTGCDFFSFTSFSSPLSSLTFPYVRKQMGYHDLPSKGTPEILVIPVAFRDCSFTNEEMENACEVIRKGFFGKSEDTYWESVRSFYEKSSYGQLHIDGKVSDIFHYDKSVYEASRAINNENEPTYFILNEALNWYQSTHTDLNSFDSDNDGYIDSVWLVYLEDSYEDYFLKHPIYRDDEALSQFLWAYTYWYPYSSSLSPRPFSYSWASYNFFHTGSKEGIDAHTFIHETGHLFGLDDYYNYDYSLSWLGDKTRPVGGLDMMDNNILDHNAFSKYLLGWIQPEIAEESGVYEVSSFQENGSALIIPATMGNDNACNEYLILEYYTPDGLNELDSTYPYTSLYPLGFTENGFKIYHVDARLGCYETRNFTFVDYIDSVKNYENYYLEIANSNTPSESAVSSNRLLSLLSSEGTSRLYFSGSNLVHAENRDLFQENDELNSFTFHSTGKKDFTIKVLSCTEEKGVLSITYA